METAESEEIERRLRGYAEEALRDFAGGIPHSRLCRIDGDVHWDETIGDDEVQFNAEVLGHDEQTLRLAVTATRRNLEFEIPSEDPSLAVIVRGGRIIGDVRDLLPAPRATVDGVVPRIAETTNESKQNGRIAELSDRAQVRDRLRRHAEEALLDLTAGLPEVRWSRLEGEMTWNERIDGDEIDFHAQTFEFQPTYMHLAVEAWLGGDLPYEMIQWCNGIGEAPSVLIDDIFQRRA